jgi:hypothetical protein
MSIVVWKVMRKMPKPVLLVLFFFLHSPSLRG